MKQLYYLLFISISFTSLSQYRIANWYQDKASATVLTYDDWSPGHPAFGVPYLIDRNLVGTFYVLSSSAWRESDYPQMIDAADRGIEIGNHTLTHPNLPLVDPQDIDEEIDDVQIFFENQIPNQRCITFAYPFGSLNNFVRTTVMENHISARGVQFPPDGVWSYDFDETQYDYYDLNTYAVNSNRDIDDITGVIQDGISDGGLVTLMFHSIYGPGVSDSWWDEIPESFYAEILDSLSNYRDQTWITTVREATRYHRQAKGANITEISRTSTNISVSLTDDLDDQIFNHPLTIFYEIDPREIILGVTQNGEVVTFNIENGTLAFEAIPDAGTIDIEVQDPLSLNELEKKITNFNLYPNPTDGSFKAFINLKESMTGSLIMKDLNGNTVKTIADNTQFYNNEFQIDLSDQANGIYTLFFTTEVGSSVQKIVKH